MRRSWTWAQVSRSKEAPGATEPLDSLKTFEQFSETGPLCFVVIILEVGSLEPLRSIFVVPMGPVPLLLHILPRADTKTYAEDLWKDFSWLTPTTKRADPLILIQSCLECLKILAASLMCVILVICFPICFFLNIYLTLALKQRKNSFSN